MLSALNVCEVLKKIIINLQSLLAASLRTVETYEWYECIVQPISVIVNTAETVNDEIACPAKIIISDHFPLVDFLSMQ